jgi:predicted transposase/invertase (TIGR01784 family)
MKFINPKTDYAFKKIFGSENSKDILISFLNAIVYQEKDVIQDLEILNPYSPGANFGLKDTYLDVKARLDNNTTVLIEMQLLNRYAFEKRVLYNATKVYSNQLESGEGYSRLNPVIALTIVDFILFKDTEQLINYFVFKERTQNLFFNDEIELVFLELPKFQKTLENLNTLAEKWIYFLNHAPEFKEKPDNFQSIPTLNKALEIANQANLSVNELDDLQKRAFWVADQEGLIIKAREEGLERGLKQGLQQGLERGLQQGQIQLILTLLEKKLGLIPNPIKQKISSLSTQKLQLITDSLLAINSWENLDNLLN